nr:putative lipid II flippase FtsW [uncultured Caproiciproducens sp.]
MTRTKEKTDTTPNRARKNEKSDLKEPTFTNGIRKKFRIFSVRSGMDMPFLFLILTLLIIGLVMLFSASYANAYYRHGSSYFFISRQAVFAVLGVTAMIFISYFDYHHLHKFAIPILLLSFMMLTLVLFMPAINKVHRWIDLGPLGQFQPSELSKFAVILVFSHLISLNFKRMDTFRYGVLPYILILGATVGLLVLEPHISATVIMVLLAAVMLFIGGVRLRWFGLAFGGAVAAVAYLVLFAKKFSYANDRIVAWLDPFSTASKAIMEDTWQTRQSLYAIGSGGLLGLGLGQSRQKYLYLPEPQNDFIFAIVCEELGFIGALIIIILFAMLVWRGISISLKAKDKFGMLLGIGLVVQVGLQVVLNIAVVTNTIPNTGISLPFFSYGGTSLVILLAEMGIVLSISRTSAIEKT